MLKKDVLLILTNNEVADAIGKDVSQVTRMRKIVPEHQEHTILSACKHKTMLINNALNRIKG